MDHYTAKYFLKKIRRNLTLFISLCVIAVVSVIILVQSLVTRTSLTPSLTTDLTSPTPLMTSLPLSLATPSELNTLQPPAPALPVQYQVQPGDSLWHIADAFYGSGFKTEELTATNKLTDPDELQVGQIILIPSLETDQTVPIITSDVPTQPDVYQVQSGDSLWKIAEQQLGSGYKWVDLYRLNQQSVGSNPNLIYPNSRLRLR